MANTFRNLDFGPMALRVALRGHLLPGERVVGWATAQLEQPLSLALFRLGLMVLPGVGHVVSGLVGSMLSPRRGLMVLTDESLWLFEAGEDDAIAPAHQVGLDVLSVSTGRLGITFNLASDLETLGPWTIDAHQSQPARRLHDALVMLAKGEAAPRWRL